MLELPRSPLTWHRRGVPKLQRLLVLLMAALVCVVLPLLLMTLLLPVVLRVLPSCAAEAIAIPKAMVELMGFRCCCFV